MPMEHTPDDASTYGRLGASADKRQVHRAVKAVPPSIFPGAFCRVLPDLFGGDEAMCVISHSDSAGTKCIVGYLAWRETGEAAALAGLATDAAVMNLDDVCCAGARGPFVLSNTIARNYRLVDGEAIKAVIEGYLAFAERMEKWGVRVEMAGGETEDLGDIVRTLTVGATLTVRCRRDEIVDNSRIRPGDAIIGVSSTGKAAWEDEENSGISSNGLTLARHRLLHRSYLEKYPEIADPGLGGGLAYTGPYRLEDPLPGSESTVGEAVLSPTRTYAPFILALLGELGQAVHGLVHLTGGGQAKNLGFGKGIHYVKAEMFEVPPVFEAVRTASEPHIPWREMYRVFNMGHRLEVMVPPKYARAVMETAAGFGLDARVVGRCEENEGGGNRVTVRTPGGDESYTA